MPTFRVTAGAVVLVAAATYQPSQTPRTLAIVNVSVIDVIQGTARANQTVVVSGNRIVRVGPSIAGEPGAEVVNGSGKFVVPGLWDMHSHVTQFGPTALDLCLAYGVTAVRDMGAERFVDAKAWRDEIAAGKRRGPRMRIASPVVENPGWLAAARRMSDRAGTPWTLHERFGPASVEEAERWVDSLAALGPDHIKVRNWPAPEIGRALAARARQRGLSVVGHANEPFPRSGVATLEHQIWPPLTSADAERHSLWSELITNGVAFVPTLVTRPIRSDSPDALLASLDAGKIAGFQYVPRAALERWRHQLLQLKQESPLDWTAILRDDARNVAEMQKAGMTLLAGTDLGAPLLVPGLSLHDELELLVKLGGMTPLQALRAATIAPARVVGLADLLGSIDARKIADLVVLDANPLSNIESTRRIHAVIADGRLFTRAELDRMLGAVAGAAVKPARPGGTMTVRWRANGRFAR